MTLSEQVEELSSVEDFFELFEVEFDENVIRPSRVKLLTLFNKSLAEYSEPLLWENYKGALSKAYCLLQHGVVVPLKGAGCANCHSEC
ncbi:MAG: nitrogenase-stabilizing/protective protein NifW [Colwellia sp.]